MKLQSSVVTNSFTGTYFYFLVSLLRYSIFSCQKSCIILMSTNYFLKLVYIS